MWLASILGLVNWKKAKDADNKMIVFSVFCCALVAGMMLVIGGFFPQIYNTSEQIKELATSFIAVSAIIMPFCSFSHASYFTLRSGGKTLVTFCLIRFLPGGCGSDSICVGTLHRTWNCERLFFCAGDRTYKSSNWLFYGTKQCVARTDGIVR